MKIIAILLALLAGTANAQGPFISMGLERMEFSPDKINLVTFTARGGYMFNRWIGVEAALGMGVNDDRTTIDDLDPPVDIRTELVSYSGLSLVGHWNVSERLTLTGRWAPWTDTKVQVTSHTLGIEEKGSEDAKGLGLGMRIAIAEQQYLRFEYSTLDYPDSSANVLSVLVGHSF